MLPYNDLEELWRQLFINSDFLTQDYPLAPLEDDCKLLRNLLDDCLRIEVGENLFVKV